MPPRLACSPHTQAVKIALELKKALVDQNRLNVSQAELEEMLFTLMQRRGFGPQPYIFAYRTVAAFYQRRQPLVLLLMGAPWTGRRAPTARLLHMQPTLLSF